MSFGFEISFYGDNELYINVSFLIITDGYTVKPV